MAAEAAIVMAGGRAERLHGRVKPLLHICRGRRLIDWSLETAGALAGRVYVAVPPGLASLPWRLPPWAALVATPGRGYPVDVEAAARAVAARPLLVLPADLYGLTPRSLEPLIAEGLLSGGVVTGACRGSPLGVSLIAGRSWSPWRTAELRGCRALINVNTPRDLRRAVEDCTRRGATGAGPGRGST